MSVWLVEKEPRFEKPRHPVLASIIAAAGIGILLVVDAGIGGALFFTNDFETQFLAALAAIVQLSIVAVLILMVLLESEQRSESPRRDNATVRNAAPSSRAKRHSLLSVLLSALSR